MSPIWDEDKENKLSKGLESKEKLELASLILGLIAGICLGILLNFALASTAAALFSADQATATANAEMYINGTCFVFSLICLICVFRLLVVEWWRKRKAAKKNGG